MNALTLLKESLLEGRMPSAELLKMLISKVLGYGILAGSCIVKMPQVMKIVNAGSAEGLAPLTFELETAGLVVGSSYGYLKHLPFSAYGESVILMVQNVFVVALIYKYAKVPAYRALLTTTLLVLAISAVLTGHVSQDHIQAAVDANSLVQMFARVPQITQNFTAKSTGQLSLITNAVNALGCIARVFTSLQEGGGSVMIRSYIIGLVLNLVLVVQILLYAGNTAKAAAKKKKE